MTRPYPKRPHAVIEGYYCGRCGHLYQQRSEADKCCGLERGTKTRILKRDRRKCVICGSTASLNVHHVDAFGTNPYHDTQDSDLVILCTSCHMKVHAMPQKTLAKLLNEIVAQKFGKKRASLMIVKGDGFIEFGMGWEG